MPNHIPFKMWAKGDSVEWTHIEWLWLNVHGSLSSYSCLVHSMDHICGSYLFGLYTFLFGSSSLSLLPFPPGLVFAIHSHYKSEVCRVSLPSYVSFACLYSFSLFLIGVTLKLCLTLGFDSYEQILTGVVWTTRAFALGGGVSHPSLFKVKAIKWVKIWGCVTDAEVDGGLKERGISVGLLSLLVNWKSITVTAKALKIMCQTSQAPFTELIQVFFL